MGDIVNLNSNTFEQPLLSQHRENDDMDLQCQVLPASFMDEAAAVMADAFSDSPAYNYIFMHDQKYRRHALEWLFKRNIPLIFRRCPSALRGILNDEGQVVACFLWTPSPHQNLSTWDVVIRAGMWQIAFRFGFATLKRLMQVVDFFDNTHAKFFDAAEDFCMLERMAVRSDYRGQGLGTKALQSVIPKTDRTMRLVTQEEQNVRFYQRLGYTIVGEEDSCHEEDDHYNYHSWFMTLGPAPSE